MNDENIKSLRLCADERNEDCEGCAYYKNGCMPKMMRDAANTIERLMAQVAELEQDKEFLQFFAKLYHDELDEETKKNIDGHLHYDRRKGFGNGD